MTGHLVRPPVGGPQDVFYPRKHMTHFPTLVRGKGVYVWDDAGNQYLDAIAGVMMCNLGQGNARVAKALARQAKTMAFTYVRYARHLPNLELSRRIAELAGPGYERCLFVSGGSEANDMAIKFLRQYACSTGQPHKTRLISLMPSFHGNTLGTMAVSGDPDLEPVYGQMITFSRKIPAPQTYRLPKGTDAEASAAATVAALEQAISDMGPENVLAFILEPVGGVATGAVAPPPSYYSGIARVCRKHDVYVIYDEVMTAVRTGTFLFAHRHPEAKPDLVVMAKGLAAGYAPLGAVLAPAAMVDRLADRTGFNPSHSYNANPVSCAAGVAVLSETMDRDLMGNAVQTGGYLRQGLEELANRSPLVGDVRGSGMLLAIELVADKESKRPVASEHYVSDMLRRAGLRNGLILYARRQAGGRYGEWSMITPPLTITREQVDELVERLEKSLAEVADELAAAGALQECRGASVGDRAVTENTNDG